MVSREKKKIKLQLVHKCLDTSIGVSVNLVGIYWISNGYMFVFCKTVKYKVPYSVTVHSLTIKRLLKLMCRRFTCDYFDQTRAYCFLD